MFPFLIGVEGVPCLIIQANTAVALLICSHEFRLARRLSFQRQ